MFCLFRQLLYVVHHCSFIVWSPKRLPWLGPIHPHLVYLLILQQFRSFEAYASTWSY